MDGTDNHQVAAENPAFFDWPTLAVVAGFWVLLIGLVTFHEHVPSLLLLVALAVLGGLYPSLQHEVIHGHPTRWRNFNWAMVGAPLGMVLPFARYRAIHLAHHQSELTDPRSDPESFYVLPETWEHAGPVHRAVLRVNRTLAARLTVGPLLAVWRTSSSDVRRVRKDASIAAAWGVHVAGCAVIVAALVWTGFPVWVYLLGFVYGGASLTALRSFVEHRASASAPRSAIVHANWFFSLLYLNNNLHYTHHQLPGAAWYRLPELTQALDADHAVEQGAGTYAGYGEIVRRYLFRSFDQPVHPLSTKLGV